MTLDALEDLVGLPLGPQEVVVVPFIKIHTHRPPEASLQGCSNEHGVVSSADVIFVRWDRAGRKGDLDIV